jgi:hypothetical protein
MNFENRLSSIIVGPDNLEGDLWNAYQATRADVTAAAALNKPDLFTHYGM